MWKIIYIVFICIISIILCSCSVKQKGASKAEESEVSVDSTYDAEPYEVYMSQYTLSSGYTLKNF